MSKGPEAVANLIYVEQRRYPKFTITEPRVQPGMMMPRGPSKDESSLVEKVIFNEPPIGWVAHTSNGLDIVQDFISNYQENPIKWSENKPAVTAGQVYKIKIDKPEPKIILARVLTQQSLAQESFVYLTNPTSNEIYVALLSDLLKQHKKAQTEH